MINLLALEDTSQWDDFVKSFVNYDIYYTAEYLEPFSAVENAQIYLLTYKNENFKLSYPVLLKDIADDLKFLPSGKFFDLETPYGYGGPIIENFDENSIKLFFKELSEWAKANKIVSQFFRFHPLLKNNIYCDKYVELKSIKQTVFMDTTDEETIYKNMNDKCRNMVKKAIKNGVTIEIDNSINSQIVFKNLYSQTMSRHNASDFYYFTDAFWDCIFKQLGTLCNIFVAKYENIIISSAIIYECGQFLHYHLSASDRDYMKFGAVNLLLYEVAKYGAKKGIKKFHLGGGVDAGDGLFIFKKSFNKNGLLDFYIGRNIFDKDKYNDLLNLRKKYEPDFDLNNKRLIGYRGNA